MELSKNSCVLRNVNREFATEAMNNIEEWILVFPHVDAGVETLMGIYSCRI
jgi:hypothetical protein